MTETSVAEVAGPPTDDPDPAGGRGLGDLTLRRPPDSRWSVTSLRSRGDVPDMAASRT
jgi:hypothetical protein